MPKRPIKHKQRSERTGVDLSELKREDFAPVTPAQLAGNLRKLAATPKGAPIKRQNKSVK